MTAAHYKGGHHPGNDLGLHYTALPPIVASCPYSDQLLVTRKFWSPGANRPSQAKTEGFSEQASSTPPAGKTSRNRGIRPERDRGFESGFLQQRVRYELDSAQTGAD